MTPTKLSPSPPIIPQHIAIMCDGNRRWARQHKLEVFKGHEQAVNRIFEPLVDHAIQRGVKYLTFWIFSTENWQRDQKEVDKLLDLFRGFFTRQIDELNRKGVRVNMIGNVKDFPEDIQNKIAEGRAKTKSNRKITVTLAMSYGGRDELVRAVNQLVQERVKIRDQSQKTNRNQKVPDVRADSTLDDLLPVTQDDITSHLDTHDLPDPELIVRTSGEQRLSGFMLWQSEYSELWFPQFHFPDFTPARLDEAIEVFNKRKRRFGK